MRSCGCSHVSNKSEESNVPHEKNETRAGEENRNGRADRLDDP